jgi:uncharacterized protein (UPF0335 family)
MSDNISAEQLKLHIEAIEQLEGEKSDIADEIKDRYALAKSEGYDAKTIRKVIALRKMEKEARDEADALLEVYRQALGLE